MSQLREVEMLVEDLLSEYEASLSVNDDEDVSCDMTESETARFIHDWAERFVNGGGLFVRED